MRQSFSKAGLAVEEHVAQIFAYLEAVCKQGVGDFSGALQLYQPRAKFVALGNQSADAHQDLNVLSALNVVTILRNTTPPDYQQASDLQATVGKYCTEHLNQAIQSAFFMVRAFALGSGDSIVQRKNLLQHAAGLARDLGNRQLLCLIMNGLTDAFFHGIVGEQAEKSAFVSLQLAQRVEDPLWLSVAGGNFAEINERCGKTLDAEKAKNDARKLCASLPASLRQRLSTA